MELGGGETEREFLSPEASGTQDGKCSVGVERQRSGQKHHSEALVQVIRREEARASPRARVLGSRRGT